jgi:uncharacterized protein
MKILAFVDLHGSFSVLKSLKNKVKKSNPDLLVCAGDFTLFDRNVEKILAKLNSFKKPVLIVPGNHESVHLTRSLCSFFDNLVFIHKRIFSFGDFLFLGWGGGGFSFIEKEFEDFVRKNKVKLSEKNVVLVTHAPPFGTCVDLLDCSNSHAGNKSFSSFIKKNNNVVLSISGHLHETAGKKCFLNKALVVNPGHFGRIYNL